MDCTGFDWKGYALGELSAAESAEYDRHAAGCARCRAELQGWQATLAPLRQLPQAEPPRRIVFVASPEPARESVPTRTTEPGVSWWRRMWASGPQLGFASATVLALAIVSHGMLARGPATAPPTQAQVRQEALKEVNRLLPQAVDAAVKDALSQRLHEELNPALTGLKKDLTREQQTRLAAMEQRRDADQNAVRYAFERLERRVNYATLSSARPQGGE